MYTVREALAELGYDVGEGYAVKEEAERIIEVCIGDIEAMVGDRKIEVSEVEDITNCYYNL